MFSLQVSLAINVCSKEQLMRWVVDWQNSNNQQVSELMHDLLSNTNSFNSFPILPLIQPELVNPHFKSLTWLCFAWSNVLHFLALSHEIYSLCYISKKQTNKKLKKKRFIAMKCASNTLCALQVSSLCKLLLWNGPPIHISNWLLLHSNSGDVNDCCRTQLCCYDAGNSNFNTIPWKLLIFNTLFGTGGKTDTILKAHHFRF